MFIPHVIVPHQRGGKRPTRRQRVVAVMTSVFAALTSAAIGAGFSRHSRASTIALTCVITGLALIGGILLARVLGGRRHDDRKPFES